MCCAWIEDDLIRQSSRSGFFISMASRSGAIGTNTVGSMLQLRIPGTYGPPMWSLEVGQALDVSRCIAASKALQLDSRYLLFIDSDMVFTPDTLERLMSYRMPVVGCAYRSRGPPYLLVANKDNQVVDPAVVKDPSTDLLKVDNIGLGFLLIDKRVLLSISNKLNDWHCFLDHTKEIGQEVARYTTKQAMDNNYKCSICKKLLIAKFFDYRSGKTNKNAVSEDYWFCLLCSQNNIPVNLATKVFVKHETQQFLDVDGFASNLRSVGDVE